MIWIHVTCLLFMFSMVICDLDNKKADFSVRRTKTKMLQFSRESFGLRWAQQSAGREYRVWPMIIPRRRRENSSVKQVATKGGDNKRKIRRKMRRGRKRELLTRQEKRLRRRGEEKRIYDENGATRRPRQRHRGHQHRRNLEKQYLVRNRTLELLDKREMQMSERLSSSVHPSVDALYERRRIVSKKVSQILGDSGAATSRRMISDFLVQKPFKKQSGTNVFRSGSAHRQRLAETVATHATVATSREKQATDADARRFDEMAEARAHKMAEGQVSEMEDGKTSRLDREQMNEMDVQEMMETRDDKMAGKQLNETGERRLTDMDGGVMRRVEEEVRNEMDEERIDPPDEKRSNKIYDTTMIEIEKKINSQDRPAHIDDVDSPFLEKLRITATKLSEREAAENNLGSDESEKELSEDFYANGYHYDYENVFSEPSVSPWSNPAANKQSTRSADDEYVLDEALLSSVYMPIDDQIALRESLTALLSRLFESLRNTTSNANEQLIRDFDFDNSLHGDLCQKWLDCKDKLEEAFLGPLALPACPCRYPSSIFYDDKIWDETGQKHFRWRDVSGEGERLDVYKPGASYCVRSLLAQGGGSVAAQHCCYDSRRRLLTRGSGAGTPNFVSPEISTILHEKIDVLPWRLCKGDFSRFNDVRPPNNDNHCKENPAEEEYQRQIETTKHY